MPRRPNGWWISPAIPTVANVALGALWAFSTVGGWGEAAFCGEGEGRDPGCVAEFDDAVLASILPAALAFALAVSAWSLPRVRRNAGRLDALLIGAAFLWIAAEAVLVLWAAT